MHKLLKQAFTLIELLVVIAIIGILSGLIIVGMNGMTQKATIAKAQVFSNSLRNSLMMNIVGEWKFDGATSERPAVNADVVDSWGGVNNGTIPASPSIPTIKTESNCVSGSCLSFDGVDDYVDFGSNSSLSMGLGDATVSFWVKFNNTLAPQIETLVGCGAEGAASGVPGYYIFRENGTDRLSCNFSDGTTTLSGVNAMSASGSLMGSTWYNIVIVFTRTSVAQAYINGAKQTGYSLTISGDPGNVQNYSSFKIGGWGPSYYHLTGKMDDVRIYNAAMPTSQIKEQYYAGLNSLLVKGEITKQEYQNKVGVLATSL